MPKVEDIKEVRPEQAIQVKEEKWVFINSLDGHVRIRKLTFNDLGIIYTKAKEDPFAMAKWMIFAGVTKPKWTPEQIGDMKPDVATELAAAIADYSGMTREAIERTRNLSIRTPGAMPSGQSVMSSE